MGYGEFVGGGSVKWTVKHNNGTPHDKKDADAPEYGELHVTLPDGTLLGPFKWSPTEKPKIRVAWTPD
jgi:hypothetical protein